MSKRSEFKKKNMKLFLKKNVFSGDYTVRNILYSTIAVTAVAGVIGVGALGVNALRTKQVDSVVEAETNDSEALADITYAEIPQLDENSVGMLLADMNMDGTIELASRTQEMVTYAPGEFDEKFVGIEDDIEIFDAASEDSEVVGTLCKGAVGDIISSDGDWVKISSGSVTGFVKASNILTGDKAGQFAADYFVVVGTITEDGVHIRRKASTDSVYVAVADKGEVFTVSKLETMNSDWVYVTVDEDVEGYVYSEFIDVQGSYPVATVKENLPAATGNIVAVATGDITVVESEKPATTEVEKAKQEAETAPTTEAPATEAPTTEAPEVAPTQVATTARGAVSLSEEDIMLMAAVVTCEAGGESYEGQLAVANVILNRLESGAYGGTISDVVYAPSQFSVVTSARFEGCVANGGQASSIQAVRDACAGNNNVGSYRSFRPTRIANTSGYSSYTVIGNHVFF